MLLLALVAVAVRPTSSRPDRRRSTTRSSARFTSALPRCRSVTTSRLTRSSRSSHNSLPLNRRLGQLGPARTAPAKLRHRRRATQQSARSRARQQRHLLPARTARKQSRQHCRKRSTHLRKSVELDQNNLIAIYKLAEEVEREGDEESSAEFQTLIQKILAAQPDNIAALVELSRVPRKNSDAETVKSAVAKIVARSSCMAGRSAEQVNAVDAAVKSGDMRAAATRTSFLRNVLVRVARVPARSRRDQTTAGRRGSSLHSFYKTGNASFQDCGA